MVDFSGKNSSWGPAPMISLSEKHLYMVGPAVRIAKIDVQAIAAMLTALYNGSSITTHAFVHSRSNIYACFNNTINAHVANSET